MDPNTDGQTLSARQADDRADRRLVDRLSATEPFSTLSASDLQWLALGAEVLDIPAGWALFRRGDVARALYVLDVGRLAVEVDGDAGGPRQIAQVGSGGVVGEIGALTGLPRSATVRALRDSTVIRLPKERFFALVERDPSVSLAMLRATAHRLQTTVSPANPHPIAASALAFVPHPASPDGSGIASLVQCIADDMRQLGERVATMGPSDAVTSVDVLHRLEGGNDRLLLWSDTGGTAWAQRCVRHADRVIQVLTQNPGRMRPPRQPTEHSATAQRHSPPADLMVVGPAGRTRHWTLTGWAGPYDQSETHHIDPAAPEDRTSLVRRLTGRAIGLVLSGGGARGFAHIGAYRALVEAGVPIDRVGGASIGSLIGAGIALGWDPDALEARFRTGFVDDNPLTDYTVPRRALLRGRKARLMLRGAFGDIKIEQMRRPFFAIAADLGSGRSVVMDAGPLVPALLASSAIPGLLPPIEIDRRVLCDGAVVDTLPVSTMRRAPSGGPVIAIDVNGEADRGSAGLDLASLGIMGVLMRAGTAGSLASAPAARAAADLAVIPSVGRTEIRDWKAFPRLVESGYQAMKAALAEGVAERFV